MRSALAAIIVAGCSGVDGPRLDSVTPAAARRGETVVVHGDGFCVPDCDGSPAGTVVFGLEIPQVRGVVSGWDATDIQVVVPQSVDAGTTEVIVTVNDRSSNAIDLEVLP